MKKYNYGIKRAIDSYELPNHGIGFINNQILRTPNISDYSLDTAINPNWSLAISYRHKALQLITTGADGYCLLRTSFTEGATGWAIYFLKASGNNLEIRITNHTFAIFMNCVLPLTLFIPDAVIHLLITMNSTTCKFYHNSILQATTVRNTIATSLGANFEVCRDPSPPNYMQGTIYDMAIFNKFFTDEEARNLFNTTNQAYTNNKTSWWKFNEEEGNIAYNAIIGKPNLTLINYTTPQLYKGTENLHRTIYNLPITL